MTKRVKPSAQGARDDAAEQWLRANDPNYAQSKRGWLAPASDALARARSETNEIHPSIEDLSESVPKGDGAYRRVPRVADDVETTIPSDEEFE